MTGAVGANSSATMAAFAIYSAETWGDGYKHPTSKLEAVPPAPCGQSVK